LKGETRKRYGWSGEKFLRLKQGRHYRVFFGGNGKQCGRTHFSGALVNIQKKNVNFLEENCYVPQYGLIVVKGT
jgi:hypothetical protein